MSCQNGLLQNHLYGERIIHVICNVFRKLLGQVCTGKMKTNPYVLVIQMLSLVITEKQSSVLMAIIYH